MKACSGILLLGLVFSTELQQTYDIDDRLAEKSGERRELLIATSALIAALVAGAAGGVAGAVTNAGIGACGGRDRVVVVVDRTEGGELRARPKDGSETNIAAVNSPSAGGMQVIGGGTPGMDEEVGPLISAPGTIKSGPIRAQSSPELGSSAGTFPDIKSVQHAKTAPYVGLERDFEPFDQHADEWRAEFVTSTVEAYKTNPEFSGYHLVPLEIASITAGEIKLRLRGGPDWLDADKFEELTAIFSAIPGEPAAYWTNVAPEGYTPGGSSPVVDDRRASRSNAVEIQQGTGSINAQNDLVSVAALAIGALSLFLCVYRACRRSKSTNYRALADMDEI